jgi:hypothetical protein
MFSCGAVVPDQDYAIDVEIIAEPLTVGFGDHVFRDCGERVEPRRSTLRYPDAFGYGSIFMR